MIREMTAGLHVEKGMLQKLNIDVIDKNCMGFNINNNNTIKDVINVILDYTKHEVQKY